MVWVDSEGHLRSEVRGAKPGTKLIYLLSDPENGPTLVREDRGEKLNSFRLRSKLLPLGGEPVVGLGLLDSMKRERLDFPCELPVLIRHPGSPFRRVSEILEHLSCGVKG